MDSSAKETTTPIHRLVCDIFEGHNSEQILAVSVEDLLPLVKKVFKTLTYSEREIIKLRMGTGDGHTYTLEEVGRIFKLTRERIRQIESKAWRKLKEPRRKSFFAEVLKIEFSTHDTDSAVAAPSSSVFAFLSVRAHRVLIKKKVTTLDDLANLSADQLREVRGCGPVCINEIRELLREHGKKLAGD